MTTRSGNAYNVSPHLATSEELLPERRFWIATDSPNVISHEDCMKVSPLGEVTPCRIKARIHRMATSKNTGRGLTFCCPSVSPIDRCLAGIAVLYSLRLSRPIGYAMYSLLFTNLYIARM